MNRVANFKSMDLKLPLPVPASHALKYNDEIIVKFLGR